MAAVFCFAISAWAVDHPSDRFDSGRSSTTFSVQIHDRLVYIPVEINGHHVQFVLDSGSSRTLVNTGKVKDLGLQARVSGDTIQGAGSGRVPLQAIDDLAVRLPGLDLYFDQASSVDLSPVNHEGSPTMDGLLGYPLLARYVVMIDYEHERVTITAPDKFVPPEGTEPLPLEIRNKFSFVAGELKPSADVTLQDRFFIDSGSGDAVDHPIANSMQSRQPTTAGVGLGTPSTGNVAKLWGFRLGPYLIRDLSIECCGGTEDTMRMLGGEVLSRFTVTFDYPHQRIFLLPNHLHRDAAK